MRHACSAQGTKFILNTLAAPLVLLGLVYTTWWFSERAEKAKTKSGLQPTISAGHAEVIALETDDRGSEREKQSETKQAHLPT